MIKNYAVLWVPITNIGNVGDDIQTLAAIHFLKTKGIKEYTYIDRENLNSYNGDYVYLIMNGWFMHNINNFPPSEKITPIFISIHISDELLIKKNLHYFKKYEPIGCRDTDTAKLFNKYGIISYFTGCLTLFFDEESNHNGDKYLVDITTSNVSNIKINKKQYSNLIEIKHDVDNYLCLNEQLELAKNLLDKYKNAELVITSRLHCVLPCIAFNTRTIFSHKYFYFDSRFSGFHDIITENSKINDRTNLNRKKINQIKKFFETLDIKEVPIIPNYNIIYFEQKNIQYFIKKIFHYFRYKASRIKAKIV